IPSSISSRSLRRLCEPILVRHTLASQPWSRLFSSSFRSSFGRRDGPLPGQRFAVSSPKNTRHVLILLFRMRVNENPRNLCAIYLPVERAANPDSIDAYCGVGLSRSLGGLHHQYACV